jgi:hypothetical protein
MKIGSYVICVDDSFSAEQMSKLSRIPKKDDYYTIRDIVEYPKYNRIGVRLEEISNPDQLRWMVVCTNQLLIYLGSPN